MNLKYHCKLTRSVFSLIIAAAMVISIFSMSVFADTDPGEDGNPGGGGGENHATDGTTRGNDGNTAATIIVAELDTLADETLWQGYDIGTITKDELDLPALTGKDKDGNEVTLDVTWTSEPEFDPNVEIDFPGYVFKAALPDGFELANGVTTPEITVFIRPADLTIQPMDSADFSGTYTLYLDDLGVLHEGEGGPVITELDPQSRHAGFHYENGTLTLSSYKYTLVNSGTGDTEDSIVLSVPANTTILLSGNSSLTATSTKTGTAITGNTYGIRVRDSGTLTFGLKEAGTPAKLTVSAPAILEGVNVSATHQSYGIYSHGLTTQAKVMLDATGGGITREDNGSSANNGNSTLRSYGIYVDARPMTITGSTITAKGGDVFVGVDSDVSVEHHYGKAKAYSYGIYVNHDHAVIDGSAVITEASGGSVIGRQNTDESYGIYVSESAKGLTVNNAKITSAKGHGTANVSGGIFSEGYVRVNSGSDVTATGGDTGTGTASYGIYAEALDVTVNGSKVNATGGTASTTTGTSAGIMAPAVVNPNNVGGTVTGTVSITNTNAILVKAEGKAANNSYGINAKTTIGITDSNVDAKSGTATTSGDGINAGGNITISNSTGNAAIDATHNVIAFGSDSGSSANGIKSGGIITINVGAGYVNAKGATSSIDPATTSNLKINAPWFYLYKTGTYAATGLVPDTVGNNTDTPHTFAATEKQVMINGKAYSIIYDGNGNTGGAVPQPTATQIKDIAFTLATNVNGLVKTGGVFYGWNTSPAGNGTHYAAGGTYTFSAPLTSATMTLYAQWTPTGGGGGGGGGGGSSGGGGGGGGGSGSGTKSTVIDPSTIWLEKNPAQTLTASTEKAKEVTNHTRSTGMYGVRKLSFEVMKDLSYMHDTMLGKAVQVRVQIDEPKKMKEDTLVSGWVVGKATEAAQTKFTKWFTNKIRVVHFDHVGKWGVAAKIAAKVDLKGMNTDTLYFYAYNPKTNSYTRIQNPEYRIDSNGYLHFTTLYAGDIIITDSPLKKR